MEKNAKKMLYCALVACFIAFYSAALPTYAYSEPAESYYAIVDTREIGEIQIYVPYNMGRYFTTDNSGGLLSTYSSTISCWGRNYSGSTQYDIRFTYSNVPEYRTGNYSYNDLNITDIIETNLPLLSATDFTLFSQGTMVNMIMLFVGGSILLFTILRKG